MCMFTGVYQGQPCKRFVSLRFPYQACATVCVCVSACFILPTSPVLVLLPNSICKYPLLLREIIRHTSPSHPEYLKLCMCSSASSPLPSDITRICAAEAYQKIEQVVASVEQGKAKADNVNRMLTLSSSIYGADVCFAFFSLSCSFYLYLSLVRFSSLSVVVLPLSLSPSLSLSLPLSVYLCVMCMYVY